MPTAMTANDGTAANLRPKRSMIIPAGMKSDMSIAADRLTTLPTWATSSPSTLAP